MGQKVNPHGMRVGINAGWNATWYANKKDFGAFLKEDDVLRKFIKKTYYSSAISKIDFERSEGKLVINVHTGRPGTLIGKQGAGIEEMKKQVLSQFKLLIDKKWMLIILDESDKVVAFGLCMPRIGSAFQKSGGRLTIPTLLKLFKALKAPKVIEFCLIGVLPEYQAKGVNSIALNGIMEMLSKDVDYCETNLCLENNSKILAQWKYFDAVNHKKRRAYKKSI